MNVRFNPNPTTNFQAKLISKAHIKSDDGLKILELFALEGSSDMNFAKKYLRKFDLKSLYPEQKDYKDFDLWERVIRCAFAKLDDLDVVLVAKDKKPCGVMSYYERDGQVNLVDLAKWKTSSDDKDKVCIGKVLMHHLFNVAHKNNSLNISLHPLQATPRGKDCRDFYSLFGFRRSANNTMNLFGADYSKKAKQLEDCFIYEKINSNKNVNLQKELFTV